MTVPLNQGVSAGAVIDRMGSVGKYALDSSLDTLDLASLYDKVPSGGKKAAINHISAAGGGKDTVTISMEDVLALSVKTVSRRQASCKCASMGMRKIGFFWTTSWVARALCTGHCVELRPAWGGILYSMYNNDLLSLELFILQGIAAYAVL